MGPSEYDELENIVERCSARGPNTCGWKITMTEDIHDEPDRLNGYPFADHNGIGVRLSYTKGSITVRANVSSNPKTTWCDLLPTLKWRRDAHGAQHTFFLHMAATPRFTYTLRHPEFFITSDTNLVDGFVSRCTATTRISPKNQVGVSFTYDPSRSGLKDYTFLFAREACAAVLGGDVVAKYNATRGIGLHLRVPTNAYTSAVVLAEKQRFIVGAEARSSCGAQMLMNINLVDQRAEVALSRFFGPVWQVALNYSAVLNKPTTGYISTVSPRFGIVFTGR